MHPTWTPPKLVASTQQWHPAMAPQKWHPAMHKQWHPCMAPSNGTQVASTQQWRPSNGTQQCVYTYIYIYIYTHILQDLQWLQHTDWFCCGRSSWGPHEGCCLLNVGRAVGPCNNHAERSTCDLHAFKLQTQPGTSTNGWRIWTMLPHLFKTAFNNWIWCHSPAHTSMFCRLHLYLTKHTTAWSCKSINVCDVNSCGNGKLKP